MRSIAGVVVVAVVACGRIGFDEALRSSPPDSGADVSAAGCWPVWRSGAPMLATPALLDFSTGSERLSNPSLSASGLGLAFETNANAGDILVTTRSALDQPWQTPPVPLAELDTPAEEEGRLSLAGDESLAVYSQGNPAQLVEATRANPSTTFARSAVQPMAVINDAIATFDPELTADGLRLYYSKSGQIFIAERATVDASFGAPAPVALAATSVADPTLSPDERVIVFSEAVPPSTMRDLYFAVRESATGTFGPPQMVPGVDTASDEGDGELSADGCELLYSSNQNGRELWSVRVTP